MQVVGGDGRVEWWVPELNDGQGDYQWQRRVVAPEASGGRQSQIAGGRGKQWGAWWTMKPNGGRRRQVVGCECKW